MSAFIIAGTDTDIGKTVFAAMLTAALSGIYFKPVQAGLADGTDTETVRNLTGLGPEHFLPELYRLNTPASPHFAAEQDGIEIDPARLTLPDVKPALIVETAGGLLVPLTRTVLQIDIMKSWKAPVILCARTALGTINHSLLSVEALKRRGISTLGIVFIGEENKDSERTIIDLAETKRLGRLPIIGKLNRETLAEAFNQNFDKQDFDI